MNFDYLEATKSLGKDKVCLDSLDYVGSHFSGWNTFYFEGSRKMQVQLNEVSNEVRIKGSIPYFIAGQNFKITNEDFKSGIRFISEALNVDLNKAEVKCFEYGTTLQLPFSVKEIFSSHIKISRMKTRLFDYGKYYSSPLMKVKLYDANKNIKDKLTKNERELLSKEFGYDPSANYLKIENKYLKPAITFKSRCIDINELTSQSFEAICKEDLLIKYKSIMKSNRVFVHNKKQLTSSTIPLIILKEYEDLLPFKAEELIKQKIKALPIEILNKEDKKSRRRQILSNIKKLEVSNFCQYDVESLLINQIKSSES